MSLRPRTRARGRKAVRPLTHIGAGALLLAGTMTLGAIVFVVLGVYDVSAVQQHTPPVYNVLDAALKRSISRRAAGIEPPPLDDPTMIEQGFHIFREQCVPCHGAPGVARHDMGKGLTPLPANLVHTARTWSAAEMFWTIKNGIKMSGMPAWRFTYSDEAIWSVVAFLERLPELSPSEYKALVQASASTPIAKAAPRPTGRRPDPERGRLALRGYACTACHEIPGVVGPEVQVGPPLNGIGTRRYIAGVLPNTVENMVRWLRNPPAVDPLTAMPDLDVHEQDALDIAAYLATLD